jgi:hypothetical protein
MVQMSLMKQLIKRYECTSSLMNENALQIFAPFVCVSISVNLHSLPAVVVLWRRLIAIASIDREFKTLKHPLRWFHVDNLRLHFVVASSSTSEGC